MKKTPPSRVSRGKVLEQLKLAARQGDRAALALALDQLRTLAYSPRYWEKYLQLLSHPLARLVDLLVIKQGEKIARQKGWVRPKGRPASGRRRKAGRTPPKAKPRGRRHAAAGEAQPSLFPELY
ncbi:MAG: hypothetical protein HYY64_16075 [Candidatus Rokubacteria bacterium]|nr:hypothetical protein [Candidatus Rokubacteria bacterium]